ncbi:MAG TPA: patatin-like phospholipase family protein [Ilumatobacteraceae bacterium]|nr:patatin-like phospholipase family protein [Ilumatobacteraceae bacterium]
MSAGARPSSDRTDSFSLVLGAGGRPGLAYHAGTLLALELHGLPAAQAVSITGTSAGSIAAAVMCGGGTAEDLAAYTTGAPPRAAFRAVADLIALADGRRPRIDVGELRRVLDPAAAWRAAAHLRARRFSAAFAAVAPGLLEIRRRFAFLDAAASVGGPQWRIVAAERTGQRCVLTTSDSPLSIAVAASCAIPGVFAPVVVNGRRLVDGGVHSTTNADLASEDRSDLVIVVAPMCEQASHDRPATTFQRDLDREVALLRAAGRRVVVFRPSARLRARMGRNPLATARCREITGGAFLEAVDVLAEVGPPRRVAASGTARRGRRRAVQPALAS